MRVGSAKVECVYTTPKIFDVEFENPWRSGVRLFIFTSYYEAKKVHLGGVRFNNNWRIFGMRLPWVGWRLFLSGVFQLASKKAK